MNDEPVIPCSKRSTRRAAGRPGTIKDGGRRPGFEPVWMDVGGHFGTGLGAVFDDGYS